ATAMATTAAAATRPLQRAGATAAARAAEQSKQAALRTLGDDSVRAIVDRYVEAWERCDVEAFAAMLADDAAFAMPPLASWYRGKQAIAAWAAGWPLSGAWRWRVVRTTANGQPALGFYAWNAQDESYRPFALNVVTFRGSLISQVTAFIARSAEPRDREAFARYPDEPVDASK